MRWSGYTVMYTYGARHILKPEHRHPLGLGSVVRTPSDASSCRECRGRSRVQCRNRRPILTVSAARLHKVLFGHNTAMKQ